MKNRFVVVLWRAFSQTQAWTRGSSSLVLLFASCAVLNTDAELVVCVQAQRLQDDPSTRLMPSVNTTGQVRIDSAPSKVRSNMIMTELDLWPCHLPQDPLKICCLHAKILDFYLDNILPYHNGEHVDQLKINLGRISRDLQSRTCVSVSRLILSASTQMFVISQRNGEICVWNWGKLSLSQISHFGAGMCERVVTVWLIRKLIMTFSGFN